MIEVAPKEECNDMTHMEVFFQDVVDKGGEGIILRDPRCPYEPGRSRGFLKHKVCSSFAFSIFANLPFLLKEI